MHFDAASFALWLLMQLMLVYCFSLEERDPDRVVGEVLRTNLIAGGTSLLLLLPQSKIFAVASFATFVLAQIVIALTDMGERRG